jgi:hypothetical protein
MGKGMGKGKGKGNELCKKFILYSKVEAEASALRKAIFGGYSLLE